MTWTYDPATDLGKVRLFSRENLEPKSVLQDEDLLAFLDINNEKVRLAAADALDYIANTQELLLRKITLTGAMQLDGPAVAADLRGQAETLRRLQKEIDADVLISNPELEAALEAQWYGMIDWAEMALTPSNTAEIIFKTKP